MKQFTTIIVMTALLLVCASCSNSMKREMEGCFEETTKVKDFKEVKLVENYFEFTQDYRLAKASVDSTKEIVDSLEHCVTICKLNVEYASDIFELLTYKVASEGFSAAKDSVETILNVRKEFLDSVKTANMQGTVYVAKIEQLDQFGRYRPAGYELFTKNRDGSLYRVDETEDFLGWLNVVKEAYPNCVKDAIKGLGEAFGI